MFASRAFRPAAQLSRHARRYASTEPAKSGATNAALTAAIGVGALSGYYWYSNSGKKPVAQEAKESGSGEPAKVFTGGDQGFINLALDKVEDINHNTKKFIFKFEDAEAVSGLTIASAVISKHKREGDEKPTIKPYTPVSDEDDKGHMDFIVKVYKGGAMSEHIHSLKPGDNLAIKGPIPKYPWQANKHEHIALLAGGTGITPMWQLCRAIFNNGDDKTKVTLVFGNVTEEDILLRKEFDDLQSQYPQRFRAFYVLDNPPEKWDGGKGFISKDLLKEVLPGPKEENIKVFVCGPPGLCKAISGEKKSPAEQGELSGFLKELGYNDSQVYKF